MSRIDDAIELASIDDSLQGELEHEILEIGQKLRDLALPTTCPYKDVAKNSAFLTIRWNGFQEENTQEATRVEVRTLFHAYVSYLEKSFKLRERFYNYWWCVDDHYVKHDKMNPMEFVLQADGDYVFSLLYSEVGIHRFTVGEETPELEVEVVPVLEGDYSIENHDYDTIRLDVFEICGPGGGSVNVSPSGIRATHLPIGIVSVADDKNQLYNRKIALQILAGRLYMHEQNALSNPAIIREYDLKKKKISDKRLKKTYEYSGEIHEVLPQIFGETLEQRIDSLT